MPALGGYYFGGIFAGVQRTAYLRGYQVLAFKGRPYDLVMAPFARDLVQGWVLIHDSEGLEQLARQRLPFVTVATHVPGLERPAVLADNFGGTRGAVRHLIAHGHRQIAYVGNCEQPSLRARLDGYRAALEEAGIPFDPQRVVALSDDMEAQGRHGIQRLLELGMPCTAIVTGTDRNAFGLLPSLRAAGYRVPEDIALVGFDDLSQSQFTQPPLTTVRTRFDELGAAAAQRLIDQLEGAPVSTEPQYVPVTLVRRRSCGCEIAADLLAQSTATLALRADWTVTLAEQLVRLALFPNEPSPATPLEQIWPSVDVLVQGLASALDGAPVPSASTLEQAWRGAVARTPDLVLLRTMQQLLAQIGAQRLAAAPADPAAAARLAAFLEQADLARERARITRENVLTAHLADLVNNTIAMTLLTASPEEARRLDWLARTEMPWGCLARYAGEPQNPGSFLEVIGVYHRQEPAPPPLGSLYSLRAFPCADWFPPPTLADGAKVMALLQIKPATHPGGLLALCTSIGELEIQDMLEWDAFLGAALERDALEAQLRERTTQLEAQALDLVQARDAAEAANRAKSAFLAQMSHELRTPLNGILGYTQILVRKRLDADVMSGLNVIGQSGEHLLTLINDILDLAKIEAGRLEIVPTVVQLPSFLDGIVGIIRARAEAKQLLLTFETPQPLPAWVLADETRLRQILLNLLGNAIKFTDRGSVTLRLSTADQRPTTNDQRPRLDDDPAFVVRRWSLVRFEVADTGMGIAPEQLERIFQPFEQVGELSRQAEGSGLGLAISRQLVRLMGSELHVASEVGRGSTFWFEAPLPLAEIEEGAAQAHEHTIAGYNGLRRTLLVVDDIPSNRAVLAAMLEPLGFTVLEAEHGQRAVELAQQARPDLILMDRHMPVLSGPEAVQQIRNLPEGSRIPIIATSASVSQADQALSRQTGYDAFLPKPIVLTRLVTILEQYLQLEWVYATEPASTEAPEMLAPPGADLAVLWELAAIGDILGLQKRAAQLAERDPALRPFAQQLAQLAGRFEVEQIQALIACCQYEANQ
jgi:signal transduction histidine kinase/DNA-binding LacI/PurR family transcriptional regulator/ActR/RegA family two-component response regulator